MNFLQICQRAREKCAITGAGPSTVTGQTGTLLRLIDWVNEAWLEIQGAHDDWDFLWLRGTFDTQETSPGVYARDYDLGSNVQRVNPLSVTCYDSDGETEEWRLVEIPYARYRNQTDIGVNTAQRPTQFVIMPNDVMRLYPRPDGVYTLQFDYYKMPSAMSENTDEPELAEEHLQWAIIYGAMRRYALYENAQEVLIEAEAGYRQVMNLVRRKHLPAIAMGAPLA
jgi:hypothetical protein